jgi:uncharacterized membrane protein (UPF0182 family)
MAQPVRPLCEATSHAKWGKTLPESIDWPRPAKPTRSTRRAFSSSSYCAIAVILFGSRTLLSYWVDLLWFRSLGYAPVFWKARGLEWGIFAVFAAATFLFLYGVFSAFQARPCRRSADDHTIYHCRQSHQVSRRAVLRIVAAIAVSPHRPWPLRRYAGAVVDARAFWYAPSARPDHQGSFADPIFRQAAQLLSLHASRLAAASLGWLLTLAVLTCILAVLFILVTGGSRALAGRFSTGIPLPWRGLSLASAFLLLVLVCASTYQPLRAAL